MLKAFAIIIIVTTFLKFEFVIKFEISLNVYDRIFSTVIYLFSLRVFEGRIIHESNDEGVGILHLQVGKKSREINLFSDESKKKIWNPFSIAIVRDILSELMITDLNVQAKIGGKDAFRVTMLMGSAKIFYCSILSFLRSKRNLTSHENFIPYYNEEVLIIDINGILRISFADIIFIIGIVILNNRHRKKEKLNSAQKESV